MPYTYIQLKFTNYVCHNSPSHGEGKSHGLTAKCATLATSNDWTNYKKLRKKLKRFWSFLHEKTKSKAIADILSDGISEYSDTAAKADLFNKYFQSVFNRDISPTHLNVENTRTVNINLSSIKFDHLQIQKIFSRCQMPRILKECAAVLAQSLTLLFEMSFASGHIPV